MQVAYYPGCSLEGTAQDYAMSIQGISARLNILLDEIPDWNCCGATSAHSINHRASIELAGRNLNLATQPVQFGLPHADLLVPCPLCFNRLKTAALALESEQKEYYRITIPESIPHIWDIANFFAEDNMLRRVAKHVKHPLKNLKAVCYYGCMANRPPEVSETADYENPQSLDRIMANIGATAIAWPFKTDCCGASQVLSHPETVSRLVGKLYDMAQQVGAQAIVVSCQMCQANLDMYQDKISADWGKHFDMPIYYFTELIGLAMGEPDVKKWLSGHIADPFTLLRELGLLE